LKFTNSGYIFIEPGDDPCFIASFLDLASYQEEFCLALDFSPSFVASLMAAGFLVMSAIPGDEPSKEPGDEPGNKPGNKPILIPKMHLERSVLFFDELHESRSARRLIPRYELRAGDSSGSLSGGVLERCAQVHGEDWLTPALRRSFHALYRRGPGDRYGPSPGARMISFGLYRQGQLVAGEFGAAAGGVYTSYSGYMEEDSAGTVQMILTGRWLRDSGFAFWDLGMFLPYKERLGARTLGRREFLEQFRAAQGADPLKDSVFYKRAR
jgi:Leu/Phe-tRNA-protein transferase